MSFIYVSGCVCLSGIRTKCYVSPGRYLAGAVRTPIPQTIWTERMIQQRRQVVNLPSWCCAQLCLYFSHSDTFTGKPIINPKQIRTIYFIFPIRKSVLDSRAEVMGWLACVEERGIIKIKISSGTTTLPKSLNLQIWQVAVERVKAGRETAEPLPSGLLFLFSLLLAKKKKKKPPDCSKVR